MSEASENAAIIAAFRAALRVPDEISIALLAHEGGLDWRLAVGRVRHLRAIAITPHEQRRLDSEAIGKLVFERLRHAVARIRWEACKSNDNRTCCSWVSRCLLRSDCHA